MHHNPMKTPTLTPQQVTAILEAQAGRGDHNARVMLAYRRRDPAELEALRARTMARLRAQADGREA